MHVCRQTARFRMLTQTFAGYPGSALQFVGNMVREIQSRCAPKPFSNRLFWIGETYFFSWGHTLVPHPKLKTIQCHDSIPATDWHDMDWWRYSNQRLPPWSSHDRHVRTARRTLGITQRGTSYPLQDDENLSWLSLMVDSGVDVGWQFFTLINGLASNDWIMLGKKDELLTMG